MFGAPFSGGAPLSFVSLTGAHASSDSSRLRTLLPVSSLFGQPAFKVTITPTSTEVTSPAYTTISSTIAPPSVAAAAAAVTSLASSSTSVSLPPAAPVVLSNTQSTVLTVTPVTPDPSAQTSSTSVVSSAYAETRTTSRRRNTEPHSRVTQPKRAVREQASTRDTIVRDSSGEAHPTVPTTENTAAASTTVLSIPNLLTVKEYELMRVRAARVVKLAYAHSCFPTPPSNPLRISDSPVAAENPAAPSSESDGFTRAPTPHLPSETLPIPESTNTLVPAPSSSSSRTRVPDASNITDPSAFAMTDDAPIKLVTEAKVPLASPASPISFSSLNTSRAQWPTSQTRVALPELPSIETSPRNVTIDPREEPRRPPESASSNWSPLPPPVRTQQTELEQTHISPMNDAVAIVLKTNPYTFRDNGVPIDLVRRIVLVEKRRILLNMRVDVSAQSVLSTPIQDRSTCRDIDRALQTYANIVTILLERLKTQFCVFYDFEYTLDALRCALPRERTVDLGKYVLLRNDALREGGTILSRSRAYTAPLEDLWRPILKRVVPSDSVETAHGLLELFDGVVKSFHSQPMSHISNWTSASD